MTTDLTIANILAHMDYEFEANLNVWNAELSTKLTLAKCRCQNDRRA